MSLTGINLLDLHQEPVKRNRHYTHKDQLAIYDSDDHEDGFVKCYRFKKQYESPDSIDTQGHRTKGK